MGAKRRKRARGPVTATVYAAHNTHKPLTYADVRHAVEEAKARAEARAVREVPVAETE